MSKTMLAIVATAILFIVAQVSQALAQTATPTPTPTRTASPTPTSAVMPTSAPQTGLGGK